MLWLLSWCLLVLPATADHGYLRSLQVLPEEDTSNSLLPFVDIVSEEDTSNSVLPFDFVPEEDDTSYILLPEDEVTNNTNVTAFILCGRSVCTDEQVWLAPTSAPTVEGTPPNNVCTHAINLGWSGEPMRGTTIGATPDEGLEFCGGVVRSGSVWYSVMGTGAKLATTTCFGATQQDTQIAVYAGQDCDNLVCVGGNDDVPGAGCGIKPFASRVVWDSRPGVKYYLLVYGFRELGDFDINVQVLDS
jgi:hypothetical protein